MRSFPPKTQMDRLNYNATASSIKIMISVWNVGFKPNPGATGPNRLGLLQTLREITSNTFCSGACTKSCWLPFPLFHASIWWICVGHRSHVQLIENTTLLIINEPSSTIINWSINTTLLLLFDIISHPYAHPHVMPVAKNPCPACCWKPPGPATQCQCNGRGLSFHENQKIDEE